MKERGEGEKRREDMHKVVAHSESQPFLSADCEHAQRVTIRATANNNSSTLIASITTKTTTLHGGQLRQRWQVQTPMRLGECDSKQGWYRRVRMRA